MGGPAARAALGVALILTAGAANAHSFGAGTDAFETLVEGANVVLFSPVSLLPCLSLGVLLTLWQVDGMVRAWPLLACAHVAGFLLAPMAGGWAGPSIVIGGAGVATLAALLPRHNRAETFCAAIGVGLFTMLASLEGHGWLELAAATYAGIFAAASLAGAGLSRLAVERLPYPGTRIGLRIAASWLAAAQILMAAFLLTSAS